MSIVLYSALVAPRLREASSRLPVSSRPLARAHPRSRSLGVLSIGAIISSAGVKELTPTGQVGRTRLSALQRGPAIRRVAVKKRTVRQPREIAAAWRGAVQRKQRRRNRTSGPRLEPRLAARGPAA